MSKLQLLRNSSVVSSLSAAKQKVEALTGCVDGEVLICRYEEGDDVKNLLAIYHDESGSFSYYEGMTAGEGVPSSVASAISTAIDAIETKLATGLTAVELKNQKLVMTYKLADESTATLDVDLSSFLSESEFGDGLQVDTDGVVSVKVADSEPYLKVDGNGIYTDGLSTTINDLVSSVEALESGCVKLDDSVTETSTNGVKSSGIYSFVKGAIDDAALVAGDYISIDKDNNISVNGTTSVTKNSGSLVTSGAVYDAIDDAKSTLSNSISDVKSTLEAADTALDTRVTAIESTLSNLIDFGTY